MGFILSACVSTETKIQRASIFANELESSTDPLDIIKAYNAVNGQCHEYAQNKWLIPIFDRQSQECYNELSVSLPGTQIGCMISNFDGPAFWNSDECIVYRRTHTEDEVIFDYKRFLPKNSPIKTDDDFKKWVKYFKYDNECKKNDKTTTTEYENCISNVQTNARLMASQLVDCKVLYEQTYTEFLKEQGEWYEEQLYFDPIGTANLLASIGDYFTANIYANARKLSYSEIVDRLQESIEDFGNKHLCSVKKWKSEMKEQGYKGI